MLKKTLLVTSALTLTVASLFAAPVANAAGVAVTVTPSTSAVSTAANIDLGFTASSSIPTTGYIMVSLSTSYTGTPTFTIGGNAASSTNATTGSIITYTLTPSVAVAAGATTIEIAGLTTPASAGNYAFTILASNSDYGGNFQYVGQGNVVQVTGLVPVSLSFAIRNAGDTADKNVCDLGVMSTTVVSTCDYRLKVGTNAQSGYTVSAQTNGNFTNGTQSFSNAAVGTSGTGGTAVTAGTENYGVVIVPGSVTSTGAITRDADYNAGSTNAVAYGNIASPDVILNSTGPNSPAATAETTNSSLVTHQAAISTSTGPGVYTQQVTYTVNPLF
jgi:hypothetical protein